jgi:RNA polymerase sigma-70 factor, ECF subfamily
VSNDSNLDLAARFEREAMPLIDELYGAALQLTLSRVEAEDLVLDSMLEAYRRLPSLRDASQARTWLCRTMHHMWISRQRRLRPDPIGHAGGGMDDARRPTKPQHRAPARCRTAELDSLESVPEQEVLQAFEDLPERLRMTLYYADAHGCRYHEIAEILDVSVEAVVSYLDRARRQLRQLLTETAYGHDRT